MYGYSPRCAVAREAVGERQGTMEGMERMSDLWAGCKVFITGATGMIGSWLVKYLLARGATVIALVKDADPQSEFFRSGEYRRSSIVNGDLEDFGALERAINLY